MRPSPFQFFYSSSSSLIQEKNKKIKKLSSKEQMSSALVFCGGFILFYLKKNAPAGEAHLNIMMKQQKPYHRGASDSV